jgi:3-deoxy-manno-octulosonate cytidylyltransferase (CMP-KDO synthetase)
MLGSKKIICIIPARLKSTRFPKKMLITLKGKPLLQWVWEAANAISWFDTVSFAIDSREVAEVIERFGGKYLMTSESCASGTDRLVELQQRKSLQADIWVNWQGDEPFIKEPLIRDLLQTSLSEPSDIWTLKKRIQVAEEIDNPHIAKVVCDANGFALYFSRSTIPYYRDTIASDQKIYYKHIGLYAFTSDALEKIAHLTPCDLEKAEQLEQLRFLYHGLRVRVHETSHEVFGIDLPEHLSKAEAFLQSRAIIG